MLDQGLEVGLGVVADSTLEVHDIEVGDEVVESGAGFVRALFVDVVPVCVGSEDAGVRIGFVAVSADVAGIVSVLERGRVRMHQNRGKVVPLLLHLGQVFFDK